MLLGPLSGCLTERNHDDTVTTILGITNYGFGKHSPGLIQHLRMAEETPTLGITMIDMGVGTER